VDDTLTETTLHVAATRPAMVMGLPIDLFAILAMGTTFVGIVSMFYMPLTIPVWWAASLLVRRDYNAPRVFLLWAKGPGFALDSGLWGGASISPFPIKPDRRYRGITPDAW
jgi:type IV secretion system protein VirB3